MSEPPDTAPPVIMLNDIAAAGVGSPVTISGTIDDSTINSLKVVVDGILLDEAVTVTNGTFNFPLTGLSLGSHTISVHASDAAGNEGASMGKTVVIYAVTTPETTGTTTGDLLPVDADGDIVDPASARYFLSPQVAIEDQAALDQGLGTTSEVMGDSVTPTRIDDQAIQGTSDSKPSMAGTFFGLAWYWWLAIFVGLLVLWWVIMALSKLSTQRQNI